MIFVSSCAPGAQTQSNSIDQNETATSEVRNECDPETDQIELNTRQTKGFGAGYTKPDMLCSVYCLQSPAGSELVVGIDDVYASLYINVSRDFSNNCGEGYPSEEADYPANQGKKVKIRNPNGRYYIYVCPNEDPGKFWSYGKHGNTIVETSAARFILYNEFVE